MLKAIFERIAPITLTIIIVIISSFSHVDFSKIKDYKFLYSNIISFSSIIIGFLITMVSILITLTGKRVLKKIHEENADNLLSGYFIYPIASGVVLALYSIISGILFDESVYFVSSKVMSIIWIALVAYFVLTTCRIFYIMLKLLKSINVENNAPKSEREEIKVDNIKFSDNDNTD